MDRAAIREQGDQAQQRVNACMEERGFQVTYDDDGLASIEPPSGPGGEESFLVNLEECLAESGAPDLESIPPASAAELSALYDLESARVSCLRDHGLENVIPLPSRENFVEEYQAADAAGTAMTWNPIPPELRPGLDYQKLVEACPDPSLSDVSLDG